MKFSEKLQKLRKEKKLSQEQLAEMLEISRQSVSKWESGQTYPEMDKLIQLCKIFDCTLDDLTNDEVSDVSIQEKQKSQVSTIIDEMLNAIDKTYTLFTHMNSRQIGKCLGELVVLTIILFACGLPLRWLGSSISSIFYVSNTIVIGRFINVVISLIHFSLALIIFFYLYDRQYLSKVDEYVENYEKEKQLKSNQQEENTDIASESKEEVETEKEYQEEIKHETSSEEKPKEGFLAAHFHPRISKKEKPVKERKKRDFSGFKTFIQFCSSFCMMLIKFLVALFTAPFLFTIIMLSACLILVLYLGMRGVILFSVILGVFVFMVLNYELLEVVYCFIFNKVYSWKRLFYMFVGSLIAGGIAIGWCVIDIAQFSFISGQSPNVEIQTDTYEYTMSEELKIDSFHVNYMKSADMIIDEKLGDKVIVEVSYMKDFDKIDSIHHGDLISFHHSVGDVVSFPKMVDLLISDMKDKTLYIYDTYQYASVKITATQENLEKLEKNYQEFIEEQNAYEQEMIDQEEEMTALRESYESQIREYEDRIAELQSAIDNGVDAQTYQSLMEENEQLKQQVYEYEERLNQLSELINN